MAGAFGMILKMTTKMRMISMIFTGLPDSGRCAALTIFRRGSLAQACSVGKVCLRIYSCDIHHVHVNVSTAAISTMSGVRQYDRLIRHVLELVV